MNHSSRVFRIDPVIRSLPDLFVGFNGADQAIIVQGFAIELGMFLGASDHQGKAIGVRFHHDTNGLGLGNAGHSLHQNLDDVLHRVEVVVVQQNPIPGR
jgi:hypothetical protein